MNHLIIVSLAVPAVLLVLAAWARLRRAAAARAAPPPLAALPSEAGEQLAPSLDIIIDAPPRLDPGPLLADLPQLAAPSVDLTLIGVMEDSVAADEAVWRTVQRALATRGGKASAERGT